MNAVTARRPYRMAARAEAAHATGERILDAAVAVFWERPTGRLSLEEVARRAGVTKQTVLRRFGSKQALLAAAAEREAGRIEQQRGDVAPGDVAGAVRALADHYDEMGEAVLRMLAEEARDPALRALADRGRAYHAAWCARAFAPALAPLRGAERDRRLAQLVAVCDVQVWRLLRHERGLSRRATELALRELVEPLAGSAR